MDKCMEPDFPIVVHCSAGLGRSGVIIMLHAALQKMRLWLQKRSLEPFPLDVFETVRQMRQQRPGMVTDHSQYTFMHFGLLEIAQRLGSPGGKL